MWNWTWSRVSTCRTPNPSIAFFGSVPHNCLSLSLGTLLHATEYLIIHTWLALGVQGFTIFTQPSNANNRHIIQYSARSLAASLSLQRI
jgi:hypothetical protein